MRTVFNGSLKPPEEEFNRALSKIPTLDFLLQTVGARYSASTDDVDTIIHMFPMADTISMCTYQFASDFAKEAVYNKFFGQPEMGLTGSSKGAFNKLLK